MAGETIITVVGNLTDDPELRFTPSGAAVAKFTVASTPRTFDKNTNEWQDGEAMFLRCSIWRQAAENVAESLQRGMRVVVQGRLKARTYETREGEKRTVFELEVEEIGPSLKFATAKVNRVSRQGGGGGGYSGGGGGGGNAGGGGWLLRWRRQCRRRRWRPGAAGRPVGLARSLAPGGGARRRWRGGGGGERPVGRPGRRRQRRAALLIHLDGRGGRAGCLSGPVELHTSTRNHSGVQPGF